MKKIGLFGGSFDPVHAGHLEIAGRAVAALGLDELRFIPCRISPHKPGQAPAPAEDRIEMLLLALRDFPLAVVDESEILRPPPSYSIDTVDAVRRSHPEARLFWILGQDQWRALPAWREADRLAKELEFIVFARDGIPDPRQGWKMHSVTGTHPASSTLIRQTLREGREPPGGWLDPEVLAYIRRQGLYRS